MKARRAYLKDPEGYICRYRSTITADDLGNLESICHYCKALRFSAEKVKGSSVAQIRFQTCCKKGQVVIDTITDPPAILRELWTSELDYAN